MNKSVKIFIAFAALGAVSVANATTLTMNFDTKISGETPIGAKPWATLTIKDTAANTVSFTLKNNLAPGSQFISELLLNLDPFKASTASNLSAELSSAAFKLNDYNGISGRKYDFKASFKTANNGNRLSGGKTATWTATGTGLSADLFNALSTGSTKNYAQMHIQGIDGDDSAKVTGNYVTEPVPEPMTCAVLGIGALGLLRRKRK